MSSKKSYIHVPHSAPMEVRTLHSFLDSVTEEQLDNEALIMYDMDLTRSAITFRELRDRSAQLAASLLDLGLTRGDHVLLIGASSIRYALSTMALHRVGANIIMLGPGGMTDNKVKTLKTMDLKAVLFDPAMKASQLEQLKEGLQALVSDQVMVTLRDEKSNQGVYQGDLHAFESLIDRGKALGVEKLQQAQDEIQPDDPHVVFFTSGSTGAPKLVQCTVHQHTSMMSLFGKKTLKRVENAAPIDAKSVLYADRPMVWGGGYGGLLRMISGHTVVWVPTDMPLSDETNEAVFKIWENEKCTNIQLSVPLLHRLSSGNFQQKYDLSCVRGFLLLGQRFSIELVETALRCVPSANGMLGYGSTEGGFVSMAIYKKSTLAAEEYGKMRVLPGNEVKIVDEEGKIVTRGETGEICVRNRQSFLKYLGNPEITKEVLSPTGWYSMGDIGKMDDEGRIEVLGRKKEFIKRATVKIFPGEIESVILKHHTVADVVVVGVPDQRFYEELCACVILKNGGSVDIEARLAELEAWCAEQWPPGADGLSLKPKYFIPMQSYPWGKTAKTDRIALRQGLVGLIFKKKITDKTLETRFYAGRISKTVKS